MKRIRFFNTYEPVTDFYRHLLPELARRGFHSIVYISRCEYRDGRVPLEEFVADLPVSIVRLPAVGRIASTRARKIAAALLFLISASVRSALGRSVDINVFLTQPPMFAIWGALLKRARGQAYVCVLMDIYPDCVVAKYGMARSGIVGKALHWISRRSWQQADSVVCIGRCMRKLVIAGGVDPIKVEMIPNWADEKLIRPVPRHENSLRLLRGWEEDFIVLYSGNMGVAHVFTGLLDAAMMLAEFESIRFVFVGQGAKRKEIEEFRDNHGLTNISMLPPQPAETLAHSQSLGDLHFVCLGSEFTGLMVPSKAYSALAAGRAILYAGVSAGEIGQMVQEEGVGSVVDPGDGAAIQALILAFYRDKDGLRQAGEKARLAAVDRYSTANAIMRYADCLERLPTARASNESS